MQRRPSIFRRLLPLYIGVFLQGLVFWYAIEKLFMVQIGFNAGTIGLSLAVYSGVALLAEIPSGILADRWSRKGVLILSSIALIISSLLGAISYSVPTFLISAATWGLYIALNSGTIESILYDILVEEYGEADNYERESGKIDAISSLALVIGSILGGVIGQFSSLRQTFWLSIPAAFLSIFFLWFFKEPKLHKHNQDRSLVKHIRLTFSSVFKNIDLIWILLSLISLSIVWTIVMEMGQLWLIALFVPVLLFGPINAFLSSIFGIGSMLSSFIKTKRNIFIGMFMTLVCLLILIFNRSVWVSIFSIFIIMIITYGINIVLTHKLHDKLPSQVRAGSASAISAIRRLLIIPTSIFFGIIATKYSIFLAGWLLVGLLTIAAVSQLFISNGTKYEVKDV